MQAQVADIVTGCRPVACVFHCQCSCQVWICDGIATQMCDVRRGRASWTTSAGLKFTGTSRVLSIGECRVLIVSCFVCCHRSRQSPPSPHALWHTRSVRQTVAESLACHRALHTSVCMVQDHSGIARSSERRCIPGVPKGTSHISCEPMRFAGWMRGASDITVICVSLSVTKTRNEALGVVSLLMRPTMMVSTRRELSCAEWASVSVWASWR